jgi:hypothetical protein
LLTKVSMAQCVRQGNSSVTIWRVSASDRAPQLGVGGRTPADASGNCRQTRRSSCSAWRRWLALPDEHQADGAPRLASH